MSNRSKFFQRRALTESEWEKVKLNAPNENAYNIFLVYLKTGTRLNELLTLTAKNVYVSGDRIRIRVFGKGKKYREIVLNRDIADYVKEMADKSKGGRVFPYPRRTVDHWFRVAANKSGLGSDVTLHSLRHTAATWALKRGADLSTIRDFLGHEDISITNIYLDAQKRFENPPEDLI